jgi:DNA polymerase III psi subunit
MYNNRALYYLKQMGITPWITKNAPTESAHKLIVLASASLPKSATHLLKQILASLTLDEEHILLLFNDEIDDNLQNVKCVDNASLHPTNESPNLTNQSPHLTNASSHLTNASSHPSSRGLTAGSSDLMNNSELINDEQSISKKINMDPAVKPQDVGTLNCHQTLARIPKNESVFWLFFGKELYSKFGKEVGGKSIVVDDLLYLIENPKQKKQVFLDLYPITHALSN